MSDKNPFGGKSRAIYTPMTETEQEALARLRERGDFVLEVKGIGQIPLDDVEVRIGDHRLGIGPFTVTFKTAGNRIVKMPYLDLELRTRAGVVLFKERQPFTDLNGNPFLVSTGLSVPMIWDIGINKIDPKVVKAIMPSTVGLTTRRGNEKLTDEQRKLLRHVRAGEAKARESTKTLLKDAVRRVHDPVVPTPKKLVEG